MQEHILEVINSHIIRLEKAFKDDIAEIKSDLKAMKESQIKLAEVIVKLGTVEDKYNIQLAICKEARSNLDKLKDRIEDIERRLLPVEKFFETFSDIKNKLIVGIGLALLSGLGTLVVTVIRMMK